MDGSPPKMRASLGFLTVVEHAQHGLFGGYLLLNLAGRPLEFHCTAPLKPSRAQEILYGPTLRPYLFGEQIGQALLSKAKARPSLICTDRVAALAVREWTTTPVALVLIDESTSHDVEDAEPTCAVAPDERRWRIDVPHERLPTLAKFRLGSSELGVPTIHSADRDAVLAAISPEQVAWNLAEPFERIREAIGEAQRGSR